jgi:hypothetical protein
LARAERFQIGSLGFERQITVYGVVYRLRPFKKIAGDHDFDEMVRFFNTVTHGGSDLARAFMRTYPT